MHDEEQVEFDLFSRKGLDDYIVAGKRIHEALDLATSGHASKTAAQMLVDLPFSRRQAYYLLAIYRYRAELKAAGITTCTSALRFIKNLNRERRAADA